MKNSIEVNNLSKTFKVHKKEEGLRGSIKAIFKREYKDIKAVQNVSFEIEQGELVGFIGPNGAGKTTTLKMLSGLLYPSGGSAKVLGYTPHERNNEFLKKISLVMGQKNQLWWDLPAIETFNLNKEIYEVSDSKYKNVLDELVEMLDVGDVIHQQVRKLSLGQRMKCELIASLIHTPKVLFLDEPTIGLDVVMQKRVREFIKDYNKKYDATVILTSHYMDDVKEICKRVIMINAGKVVFDGKLDDLIKEYADYKILTFVFSGNVKKKDFEEYGEIVEYDPLKVVLNVGRENTSKAAAKILQVHEVDDLNISEPKLEDIIREAFENGH